MVIRFAGDSGDGMQLAGDRFTLETAAFGSDLSTLPNFPAEIRAPAGRVVVPPAVREGFGLGVAKMNEVDADQVVKRDATDTNLAFALSRLSGQDLNHAVMGIVRTADRVAYDDAVRSQVAAAKTKGTADLQALVTGRDTWTIAG